MDRRVTSPNWGLSLPCKQALTWKKKSFFFQKYTNTCGRDLNLLFSRDTDTSWQKNSAYFKTKIGLLGVYFLQLDTRVT